VHRYGPMRDRALLELRRYTEGQGHGAQLSKCKLWGEWMYEVECLENQATNQSGLDMG